MVFLIDIFFADGLLAGVMNKSMEHDMMSFDVENFFCSL